MQLATWRNYVIGDRFSSETAMIEGYTPSARTCVSLSFCCGMNNPNLTGSPSLAHAQRVRFPMQPVRSWKGGSASCGQLLVQE